MLTLLALACAGTPASTGCFNGGAFVGAQAGFTHVMLKKEAKANPLKKDAADKKIADLVAALEKVSPAKDKADLNKAPENDTYKVSIDLSDLNTSDEDKAAKRVVDALTKALGDSSFKTSKNVTVAVLSGTDGSSVDFSTVVKNKVVTDFLTADNVKKYSAQLVSADAETKYTSNNGFAGLHAGYLGRVNDKFLVGGLVEGNFVFGQKLKVDSQEEPDTNARFNVNVFLRAMFNLTEKFMAGADLGFSGQEIRQPKAGLPTGATVKSSDKESKWFWNPAARLVLGVTLTDNILATAHFGGVFPVMKQDSLQDKSVKAKYSNFHGGVGISYVFGG